MRYKISLGPLCRRALMECLSSNKIHRRLKLFFLQASWFNRIMSTILNTLRNPWIITLVMMILGAKMRKSKSFSLEEVSLPSLTRKRCEKMAISSLYTVPFPIIESVMPVLKLSKHMRITVFKYKDRSLFWTTTIRCKKTRKKFKIRQPIVKVSSAIKHRDCRMQILAASWTLSLNLTWASKRHLNESKLFKILSRHSIPAT